jgi:signal transduction histidine kinase
LHLNAATTVSFACAATTLAVAVLAAGVARGPASRHFRFAAWAALAGASYCLSNAVLAGQMAPGFTVWAGRFGLLVATLHGAAWLAFLCAWDRRPLARLERRVVAASLVGGVAGLVPGWAAVSTVTERTIEWADITYRDPDVGPLGVPIMGLVYAEQVLAGLAALRTSRRAPRARIVAVAFGLLCVAGTIDLFSALHLVDLPYVVDPVIALTGLSIGSVVVSDAAESGAKSLELERTRATMAERENLAALGQLAAVVAHEVRNPVAIIFGALASLQRAARSEDDALLLGIVGDEAERLKQLIARLLDAVRPFELQYTRRPVDHLVRAAISQVTAGAGVAPTQIELVTAPSEEIECDEVLLEQAISNLVQNALMAPGRRSPVRVRAVVDDSTPAMLRLDVTDDGEGVPVDVRPRLFTPFFTTRATGTGLGLALVRRIAGAHGGTVEYDAPAEGGARFVLRIPLGVREASA